MQFFRGKDFRRDYSKLGVLCALFPDIPCLAMTATANQSDMDAIRGFTGFEEL